MDLEWKALRWNRRCENQIHFKTFIKYDGETFLKLPLMKQECSYRCLVWYHQFVSVLPLSIVDQSVLCTAIQCSGHHGLPTPVLWFSTIEPSPSLSLSESCLLTLCKGDSASFDNPAIGHQLLQKRQPFLSCRRTTGGRTTGRNQLESKRGMKEEEPQDRETICRSIDTAGWERN